MEDAVTESNTNTNALIKICPVEPIDLKGSQILCATCVPQTSALIIATKANELISTEASVLIESEIRGTASVRYSYIRDALPETETLVLVLSKGIGLQLYQFPSLIRVRGELGAELQDISKNAQMFSVDSLGAELVNESFRVALVEENSVVLLDVNPIREKVTILGQYSVEEPVIAVAFSEMTIVASTAQKHFLLRISRGGFLAVSAEVPRSEKPQRQTAAATAAAAVGEGGAAVFSFFGGFFAKKNMVDTLPPTLALALPDNKWLLLIDGELITFSSYGKKVDEMENVFKSRAGMKLDDGDDFPRPEDIAARKSDVMKRNSSVSSFNSVATGVTHMTILDEAQAPRSAKPPVVTAFSSPFVLSVSEGNELLLFAANGSVPGVMEKVSLLKEEEKQQGGRVKLVVSRFNRTLAIAYWPSGKMVQIELIDTLDVMVEQKEIDDELRMALALVPTDQIDRMISLRRKLASQAREQEWHDAAIQHMDSIVILSRRREGIDQADLVCEAVELRGPQGSGWDIDRNVATIWADFLFKLRRTVMLPSRADIEVLATLCRADSSAERIKKLFSVKHHVSLNEGAALITSKDCELQELDREEALVALYTSLAEHSKALVLLESSKTNNAFDAVAGYLTSNMSAHDDPIAFFNHLQWLAHHSHEQAQGERKLKEVVMKTISNSSEHTLQQLFEVLVEESDNLLGDVIDELTVLAKKSAESADMTTGISSDAFASSLLTGMAKADGLKKKEVFSLLRRNFGSRILYHSDANYHSYTLLQALQNSKFKDLGLHEELAYLLGRQGSHELAADELAAESNLAPGEAIARLRKTLPLSEQSTVGESLAAAYLRVSANGRAMRVDDASQLVRYGAGTFDIEKLLLDGRCSDDSLSLSQIRPLLAAALVAGSERLRLAEVHRALRKSEVRRLREKVMTQRRRFIVIGHDRACTLCTRRIADFSFAAYPDGSVAHITCHMSKESR